MADFDQEDCLKRYRSLIDEMPEMFADRPDDSIAILTTPEMIDEAREAARSSYRAMSIRDEDDRVGVLTGGPYSSLVRDAVRFPNGRLGLFHRIMVPNGVVILPIMGDQIVLIRIYRHPIGEWMLEAPRGIIEDDCSLEENARRELKEEIEADADELIDLGRIYTTPGLATEWMHLFAARIGSFGKPEMGEGIGLIETFDIATIERMTVEEGLVDSPTICAIFRARLKGLL